MKIQPSPCETCDKNDKCWPGCDKWHAWYKESWRELRRRFLGESKVGRDGK